MRTYFPWLCFAVFTSIAPAAVAQRAEEYVRPGAFPTMNDSLAAGASQFHSDPVSVDLDGDGTADAMLEIDLDDMSGRTGLVLARHDARGWSSTFVSGSANSQEDVAWNDTVRAAGHLFAIAMRAAPVEANGTRRNRYALWSASPGEAFASLWSDTTANSEETWSFEASSDGNAVIVTSSRGRYRLLTFDMLRGEMVASPWGARRPR